MKSVMEMEAHGLALVDTRQREMQDDTDALILSVWNNDDVINNKG